MQKVFLGFLLCVPVALGVAYAGAPAPVVFSIAALALVPLSKFLGESVEELSSYTSPALGGLLSATFGNATELIVGIIALRAGLIDLVKASITGSIIGNLLLVVGMAMLAGGWKREKQTFNRTGVLAAGSSLFLVVIALSMPAIFLQTAPQIRASTVQQLSVVVSIILLLMYLANLLFSLYTHKHLYTEETGKYEPRWSVARSITTLFFTTMGIVWISDLFVGAVETLITHFGWSQLFIGVIVIAIIGNVAEHAAAVTTAIKNRVDLSLQIAIGSASQIAMLVAPILVFASIALMQPMNLVFNLFELVSIILSVLIINLVLADGESNWLEGAQLLASYAVIAVAFFFHP